jgi:hypothetical protein
MATATRVAGKPWQHITTLPNSDDLKMLLCAGYPLLVKLKCALDGWQVHE